ncbi:ferritin-like domain-containing protein [Hymenobacter arizonensis]|uniref:Ferritin-like domain-containing protein n=1 Tax=Hymenobacter arizonensis TaxID=1227077 RepID=A0A1I5WHH4_HYMAR|nr:ferritin-like domain-containing protein [Hymenobacter arizonensis]SFQ19253.1 Ferritin-like domain-containing protein [Hymenobacter arizonensis]
MNFFQIIEEIEKVDPEVYDRLDSRRAIFNSLRGIGQKVTLATAPLALSALFSKAYGQTSTIPAGVRGVLEFALGLEDLEYQFYRQGLDAPGLTATLTGAGRTAITTITAHERAHQIFLRTALGATAPADRGAAPFDFTGSKGGTRQALFPTVYTDYNTFLAVAQALEDTGVRAYKGGAPALKVSPDILTAALNIHSVEARHASHIRTMRRTIAGGVAGTPSLSASPKSWISGNDGGGPAPSATAGIYAGEEITTQATINLLTNTTPNPSVALASESFDEPLDAATVTAIASNFLR